MFSQKSGNPGKKEAVRYCIEQYKFSERCACRLIGLSRHAYWYQPQEEAKQQTFKQRLQELSIQYPRYGYLLLHGLLKQEGLVVNKKRTYRVYRELGLSIRTKQRKKLSRAFEPKLLPSMINERWSMDFVSDALFNGRRIRVLNIVDDYSREVVGQLVDFSISGQQVARFLDKVGQERGLPTSIVCDNGTEFTSKAMHFWSMDKGVRLSFTQPGKPTQNAYVESLNGKFRNECLNLHWFRSLAEARYEVNQWREHYNHVRPHSALNYQPPAEFVKLAA